MKKFIILILGLTLSAASCNIINDIFNISPGTRGVFKSEDNGETYHTANLLQKKGTIDSVSVVDLVFDPQDLKTLYLGSTNGLYKSTDSAASWRYILSGISIRDLDIDRLNSKVIYAAGQSGGNGKIIKSIDAGSSWIDIYTEPSKSNSVIGVEVSATSSSVVYAVLGTGELIRSTDSGSTWQAMKNFEDKPVKITATTGNVLYVLTQKNGLYKSADQGLSWLQISKPLTETNIITSFTKNDSISVSGFYDFSVDSRQFGVIYLATDQGLLRTVNDGNAWLMLKLPVKSSPIKVNAVSVSPTNPNALFATVGFTIFKTNNGGLSWETKELASKQIIKNILINPQSSNVMYLGLADK